MVRVAILQKAGLPEAALVVQMGWMRLVIVGYEEGQGGKAQIFSGKWQFWGCMLNLGIFAYPNMTAKDKRGINQKNVVGRVPYKYDRQWVNYEKIPETSKQKLWHRKLGSLWLRTKDDKRLWNQGETSSCANCFFERMEDFYGLDSSEVAAKKDKFSVKTADKEIWDTIIRLWRIYGPEEGYPNTIFAGISPHQSLYNLFDTALFCCNQAICINLFLFLIASIINSLCIWVEFFYVPFWFRQFLINFLLNS